MGVTAFIASHAALTEAAPDHSGAVVLVALVVALIIAAIVCGWREHH